MYRKYKVDAEIQLVKMEKSKKGTSTMQKAFNEFRQSFTSDKKRENTRLIVNLVTALTDVQKQYPELAKGMVETLIGQGYTKQFIHWMKSHSQVLTLLTQLTETSVPLVQNLLELGYVKYLTEIIRDGDHQSTDANTKGSVVDEAMGLITHLVEHDPDTPEYEAHRLKDALMPYLAASGSRLRLRAVCSLAALITEEENYVLLDTGCLKLLVSEFGSAISSADRCSSNGFTVHDLLAPLGQLAVNDTNKSKLVDYGILSHLVTSLQTGEEREQVSSLTLTWSLTFNDQHVKEKLFSEEGYVDAVRRLADSDNDQVKQVAEGALWRIKQQSKQQDQGLKMASLTEPEKSSSSEQHIFISYQWDHQEIVVSIKDRLKALGYRVWLDLEAMNGSTLSAMARAVENAAVVLICASHKYKLSPNCRSEAEYTFTKKTPIIPLMLQRKYTPDGWLGMLMGAKLYVNFDGKYPFDEAMELLDRELEPYRQVVMATNQGDQIEVAPQTGSVLTHSTHSMTSEADVTDWEQSEVSTWAKRHDLFQLGDKTFRKFLKQLDGKTLHSFCKLKSQAPEFFYRQMKSEFGLHMVAMLQLDVAMEDLQLK